MEPRPYPSDRVAKAWKKQRNLHKQKGALRLYRLLEKKLFGDVIQAKRFRKWQNCLLQERISQFKRNIRKSIRKYFTKKLELLGNPLLKRKAEFLERLKTAAQKVVLPANLKSRIGALHLLGSLHRLQARSSLQAPFAVYAQPPHKAQLAFTYWKAAVFVPSPFLKRKLILLVQVASIVLTRNKRVLGRAWLALRRSNPLCLPLLRLLQTCVNKRFHGALLRLRQPQHPVRRRWQDPNLELTYKRNALKTGGRLVEALVLRKLNVHQAELLRLVSAAFKKWKLKATRSMVVPSFVRKRHARKWSISSLFSFLQHAAHQAKLAAFARCKGLRTLAPGTFPIDKLVIANQAVVLTQLDQQLKDSVDAFLLTKRLTKVNALRFLFLDKWRQWFAQWRRSTRHTQGLDKETLFKYLSDLENQVSPHAFESGQS